MYRKILQNSGRPIKCQGWEGGGEMEYKKSCKLRYWEGWVSTLALILEGETYLFKSPFGWSKFEPSAVALKKMFWDLKGDAVYTEG